MTLPFRRKHKIQMVFCGVTGRVCEKIKEKKKKTGTESSSETQGQIVGARESLNGGKNMA